jgi:hypothetical protein
VFRVYRSAARGVASSVRCDGTPGGTVVHMRTRLVELVTTYVCKVHEGELAANLDCARRGFPAQTFPLCLAGRIADRIAYQLPPRAIIRLP